MYKRRDSLVDKSLILRWDQTLKYHCGASQLALKLNTMANIYITTEYEKGTDTVKGVYHGFDENIAYDHFDKLDEGKNDDTFVVLYQVDIDEDEIEDMDEDQEYDYVADLVFSDLSPDNKTYVLKRS